MHLDGLYLLPAAQAPIAIGGLVLPQHDALVLRQLMGEAGLTGHAQLGFIGGLIEGLTHLVVHHFIVDRIAVEIGRAHV